MAPGSEGAQNAGETVIETGEHASEIPTRDILTINMASVSEAKFRNISSYTPCGPFPLLYVLNDRVKRNWKLRLEILLFVHAMKCIEDFIDILDPFAVQVIIH